MSDMNEINILKLLSKFHSHAELPLVLLLFVYVLLCMIVIKQERMCFQKSASSLCFTHMILSTNIYLGTE